MIQAYITLFWLGLAVAGWCTIVLLRLGSSYLSYVHLDIRNAARLIVFTCGISFMTLLLLGLLPALKAARVHPLGGLKKPAAPGFPRLDVGKVLVTAQVGLSLVLAIGAGLFVQTLANISRVDPGFDTNQLLLFHLNAGQAGYEGQQLAGLYKEELTLYPVQEAKVIGAQGCGDCIVECPS